MARGADDILQVHQLPSRANLIGSSSLDTLSVFGVARQEHRKVRALLYRRRYINRSAVRLGDRATDVQTEPETRRFVMFSLPVPTLNHDVEDVIYDRCRDDGAAIVHFQDDPVLPPVRRDLNGGITASMTQPVLDQIGDQLHQSPAIPFARNVAFNPQCYDTAGMMRARLVDHPAERFSRVTGRRTCHS